MSAIFRSFKETVNPQRIKAALRDGCSFEIQNYATTGTTMITGFGLAMSMDQKRYLLVPCFVFLPGLTAGVCAYHYLDEHKKSLLPKIQKATESNAKEYDTTHGA
jgi:hypothetical protein